jgi:hypothetical protein
MALVVAVELGMRYNSCFIIPVTGAIWVWKCDAGKRQ